LCFFTVKGGGVIGAGQFSGGVFTNTQIVSMLSCTGKNGGEAPTSRAVWCGG